MNVLPVGTHFSKYFDVAFANTPELLRQVGRVRFDVYCREFGYLQEENYPDGIERDDYDAYSLHCLVTHRQTNTPAGCVRLVKIPQINPDLLLPLEKFCGSSLNHKTLHPGLFPRATVGEVSRLAVHAMFRRRRGESASPLGASSIRWDKEPTEEEYRTFPLITVALIAASTSMMVLTQRPNLFIMIEKSLAVLLRRLGLHFAQVGEPVDYHGPRAAYFITTDKILSGMKEGLRELYDYVYSSLEACALQSGIDLSDEPR